MQQQSGWMRHLRWVTSATSFFVITVLFSFTYHDLLWASDMSKKYKYIIYKYICSNLISWTQMRTHVSTQTVFFQLFPQRFQQMFTPSWTHLKVVICNMTPGTMHPSVAFRKKTFHSCILQRNIFFENITCHSQTSQSSFSSFGMLNQSTDHSIVSMGTGPPLEVLPKTN